MQTSATRTLWSRVIGWLYAISLLGWAFIAAAICGAMRLCKRQPSAPGLVQEEEAVNPPENAVLERALVRHE